MDSGLGRWGATSWKLEQTYTAFGASYIVVLVMVWCICKLDGFRIELGEHRSAEYPEIIFIASMTCIEHGAFWPPTRQLEEELHKSFAISADAFSPSCCAII